MFNGQQPSYLPPGTQQQPPMSSGPMPQGYQAPPVNRSAPFPHPHAHLIFLSRGKCWHDFLWCYPFAESLPILLVLWMDKYDWNIHVSSQSLHMRLYFLFFLLYLAIMTDCVYHESPCATIACSNFLWALLSCVPGISDLEDCWWKLFPICNK